MLDHEGRTEGLSLDIHADFVDQVFLALSWCVLCPQNLAISEATSVSTHTSPVPFGRNTPALHTQCQMQCCSLQHAGLTSLTLRQVPDRFQQTVEDILATLECMHSLMCLHLRLPSPAAPVFSLARHSIISRKSIYPIFLPSSQIWFRQLSHSCLVLTSLREHELDSHVIPNTNLAIMLCSLRFFHKGLAGPNKPQSIQSLCMPRQRGWM